MPAPEVTEEVKNDLKILQMRAALDPKRFYKKNDLKVLPKYFQVIFKDSRICLPFFLDFLSIFFFIFIFFFFLFVCL